MADFTIKGIEGLNTDILEAAQHYPKEVEKHLKKTGDVLKKKAIEKTPDSGTDHKRKLSKSWKSEIEGMTIDSLEYQIRNTAPHYHLVERGHKMVTRKGRTIGFVQGRHFFEKACDEFNASDEVGQEMDRFIAEIQRKISHD